MKDQSGPPARTLKPTARVLAVLDLLQDGPLYSTHIKTWLDPNYDFRAPHVILKNGGRGRRGRHSYIDELLIALCAGHYIAMPEDARIVGALARPRLYELQTRGKMMLLNAGLLRPWDEINDPWFKHRVGRSTTRFSFAMAGSFPGIRVLTQAHILAGSKCPEATRQEKHPSFIPLDKNRVVIPDADIFGLEYTSPERSKAYMFFHGFEFDRGTGRKVEADYRKTMTSMVRNYNEYLERRLYQTRYGLEQISIPIVTTKPGSIPTIKNIIAQECRPAIQKRFLLKADTEFPVIPHPTAYMVTEPWDRVGAEPLHILETLKVTAERRAA